MSVSKLSELAAKRGLLLVRSIARRRTDETYGLYVLIEDSMGSGIDYRPGRSIPQPAWNELQAGRGMTLEEIARELAA